MLRWRCAALSFLALWQNPYVRALAIEQRARRLEELYNSEETKAVLKGPGEFLRELAEAEDFLEHRVPNNVGVRHLQRRHEDRELAAVVISWATVRLALLVATIAVAANGFRQPLPPAPTMQTKLQAGVQNYFDAGGLTSYLIKLETSNGEHPYPIQKLRIKMEKGSIGEKFVPKQSDNAMVVQFLPEGGEIVFKVEAVGIMNDVRVAVVPKYGMWRRMTIFDTEEGEVFSVPLGSGVVAPPSPNWDGEPSYKRYATGKTILRARATKVQVSDPQELTKSLKFAYSAAIKMDSVKGFINSLRGSANSERMLVESDDKEIVLCMAHGGSAALRVRVYTYSDSMMEALHLHAGDGSSIGIDLDYHMYNLGENPNGEATVHAATLHLTHGGHWMRIVLDHDGESFGLSGVVTLTPGRDTYVYAWNYETITDDGPVYTVNDNGTTEYWAYVYN